MEANRPEIAVDQLAATFLTASAAAASENHLYVWDSGELIGIASDCEQMTKVLYPSSST
jgi:hypothetical protein